jgi:hypothetical protein
MEEGLRMGRWSLHDANTGCPNCRAAFYIKLIPGAQFFLIQKNSSKEKPASVSRSGLLGFGTCRDHFRENCFCKQGFHRDQKDESF